MSDDLTGTPPAPPTPPVAPTGTGDTGKILAALSFPFWFPVGIIAVLLDPYKDDPYVRSNAIQGMGLGVAIYALSAVGMPVLGLGGLIALAGTIYQIILAVKVWNGETVQVPVVYGIVKNWIEK